MVVGIVAIKQFSADFVTSVHKCLEKVCHLSDFVSQSLGYARGGVHLDESVRRSGHSESLRCRLCGKKTSAADHDLVGDRRFPFDSR